MIIKKINIIFGFLILLCACFNKPYWANSSKRGCTYVQSDKIHFTIDSIETFVPHYFFSHGESYSFYDLIESDSIREVHKDSLFLLKVKDIFSKDRRFMQIVKKGPKSPKFLKNQEVYTSQVIVFHCKYENNPRTIYTLCSFSYRYYDDFSIAKCNALLVKFVELYNSENRRY